MDPYLIAIIVLFSLAVADLIVGVSNDAVNFLNSAVGSKSASRITIMVVASLGMFLGTFFAAGMMEVARTGVFNPGEFRFEEVMFMFLAVMFTDVLLLDFFNTFGLPTSTTVSLLSGLLGASVMMSILKIIDSGSPFSELSKFINTGSVLGMFSAIFLSVILSFIFGSLIQFITRLIFTFKYHERIKRYGALWGGAALAFITFFILVKGAKGAAFFSAEQKEWIASNPWLVVLYSFIGCAILLEVMILIFKINIFKPIVLIGTFGLALSFAANDLVNFIGIPLAGLRTYEIGTEGTMMTGLAESAHSNPIFLIASGIIMTITLWVSKKARTVTKTGISLGRQEEGFERFGSSFIARQLVRGTLNMFDVVKRNTPKSVRDAVQRRTNTKEVELVPAKDGSVPAFDLVRAAVILVVSSALISFGTSMKLPLSTTYVTFMVAMACSFSDKAWGRESAVYRVNGVISVIGGWFLTAFIAFLSASVFVVILYFGHIYAVIGLSLFALFIVLKASILHKKRTEDDAEREKSHAAVEFTSGLEAVTTNIQLVRVFLSDITLAIKMTYEGVIQEDRKMLKEARGIQKKIKRDADVIVANVFHSVKLLSEREMQSEHLYGRTVSSMYEITAIIRSMMKRLEDHVDNNHKPPQPEQAAELRQLVSIFENQMDCSRTFLETHTAEDGEKLDAAFEEVCSTVQSLDKSQVVRIKAGTSSPRNTLLFLSTLSETENLATHIYSLVTGSGEKMKILSVKNPQ